MDKDPKKEYLVQVTIIEGRCFKPKTDGGLANPFVKLKCGNLPVQATGVEWDRLEANWNQSFTFEGLKLTEQELQSSDLCIEVWSKNRFLSNDFIGLYQIGLSTLYKNANHEFYNMWLVLYNQDEDPEEAQGYLLIDAFIIGPGDRPPVHDRNEKVNQDVAEEDEDINIDEMTFEQLRAYQEKMQSFQIIGRPPVARKGFQLSSYIFKCEGLAFFRGKKPNAFVSARVAGLIRKTKTVTNNSYPVFNQKMLFPVFFPFLNDKILLRIWNERGNLKDEFIANIPEVQTNNDYFNLSKLISMGGRMPSKWVNLYGIPDWERNSGLKKKINHPKEGTWFMGRVLLSFSLIATEHPMCSTLPCNSFYEQEPESYNLFCDIYQLKFLKEDQYDICVWCDCRMGSFETGCNVQKKPNKKGAVKWTCTEDRNDIALPAITNMFFPKDFAQVPDIFVNLYTGCGKSEERRIGYIRLKAEEVNEWSSTAEPRWLHFKPLDTTLDSPGSVLINLQFLTSGLGGKRVFKQPGILKKYTLFTHIVQGFELCPKLKEGDEEIKTKIQIDLNDSTPAVTRVKQGRYPVWNEQLEVETELDWKLDFTPDVVVTAYREVPAGIFNKDEVKDEIIGTFTVPVHSIKKLKKYPHYFNLLKNNEITGRIMAMFYIIDTKSKALAKDFGIIQKKLENKRLADIKVFTLGLRNLDFDISEDFNKEEDKPIFNVSLTSYESTTIKPEEGKEISYKDMNPNNEDRRFLNINNCYEFKNVEIRGDDEFQIFPYVKLEYIHEKWYGNQNRFIVFNLSEFVPSVTDNKKKLYRVLFEQNLGLMTLDQKQLIISKDIVDDDLITKDDDEDENVPKDDNLDVLAYLEKKKKPEKEKKVDLKQFGGREDKKMVYLIKQYKNMVVDDVFDLKCMPEDKLREKEHMRQVRKAYYSQIKELRKLNKPTKEQKELLVELEDKFRNAKKPQMNEPMFYGFEDISDEYNYGRDIYKEDIYEAHPNLKIPYKKRELYNIPKSPFEEAYESEDGFFKKGKLTDNFIKFNVLVTFQDEFKPFPNLWEINVDKFDNNGQKKDENDIIDEQIEKDLERYDIFHPNYLDKFKYLFLNRETRRLNKEHDVKLPLNNLKVRVYIYRCLNLTAQDNFADVIDYMAGYNAFSIANSYVEIQVGQDKDAKEKGTKYAENRDSRVPNSLNPDFYQMFEFEADLPRDWKLNINVLSYSEGSQPDSLIGSTTIDLEDRYLGEFRTRKLIGMKTYESEITNKIREFENDDKAQHKDEDIAILNQKLSVLNRKIEDLHETEVPVEYRPLFKPGVSTAQGIIEMFVEILSPQRAKIVKPAKIERPPPEEYEIRLVIWEARNIVYEGKKKTIDAMISVSYDPEGYLSDCIQKETDVHLGCDDGKPIWNWRMKFNLTVPCTFPRLTFDLKDFNTFSADEALCSCTISVKRLIKKLVQDGRLELKKKWIQFGNRNDPGEVKAELKIDLYFLQKSEADQNPVGEAQDEPNHSPRLIRPKVGRGIADFLKGTFLDFTGFKFNFSLKIWLIIILVACLIIIVFVILFVAPGIFVK